MSAVIGALRAELSASVAQFADDMGRAGKEVDKFASHFRTVARDISRLGDRLTIGLTAPIVAFGVEAAKASIEARQAMGQVEAALTSMGNRSGRSAAELEKSAKALEHLSLYDDDQILRKVTANLLTFGNVSGDVFDRAQKAAVNMAARLQEDLQPATIQIGKALNDPIGGLKALSRVGVQFTEDQKKLVTQLVRTGHGVEAQKIILAELEKEFGGAAEAMRKATPQGDFLQAWHEFKETVGAIVVRVLPPLTEFLTKIIDAFDKLSPGIQTAVVVFAALLAVLGPILFYLGAVFDFIVVVADALAAGFEIAGIGAVAGALAAIGPVIIPIIALLAALAAGLYVFRDTVGQALAVVGRAFKDLFDQAKETFGPPVARIIAAFSDMLTQLTSGPLGDMIRGVIILLGEFYAWEIKVFGSAVIQAVGNMFSTLATFFEFLDKGLRTINDLLRGDFSAAWRDAGEAVQKAVVFMLRTMALLIPPLAIVAAKVEAMSGKNPLDSLGSGHGAPVAHNAAASAGGPPPVIPPVFNMGHESHAGANRIKAATEHLRRELRTMSDAVSHGLDEEALPKATSQANALRRKIEELTLSAKESGVNVKAFAGTIATLQARIKELEIAGLQKEAEKFAREVANDQRAVDKFAKGGLPPLSEALQQVDDDYQALKDKIEAEIEANKALADSNATAAAAMASLQDQLGRLEAAHGKATEAAKAQYAAEKDLADLNAKLSELKTSQDIRDLKQASGRGGGFMSQHQQDLQKIQDDLDQKRLEAAVQLRELEAARDEALRKGDGDAASRLATQIDLQSQYMDLVDQTTAAQIDGANRVQDAYKTFADDLSSALLSLGKKGTSAVDLIRGALDKLAENLFMKPGADQIGNGISGFFQKLFGGGGSGGGGLGSLSGARDQYGGGPIPGFQDLFFGGGGSSGASFDAGGFAGLFGPGGGLNMGSYGIVGDRGPELFAPSRSGYVIPNHELMAANDSGGQGDTFIWHVATPEVNSFNAGQRQMAQRAKRTLSRA